MKFINRRGQTTLYVIIAIVIVVVGIIIFSLRGSITRENVPSFAEPVENSFLSCIQDKTEVGIKILESKGGYMTNPVYHAGTLYQPFSSELDLFGVTIPYWYYFKGSNLVHTQIPEISMMENQLRDYLQESLADCNFQSYIEQGYGLSLGEIVVTTKISDQYVDVEVKRDVSVSKD